MALNVDNYRLAMLPIAYISEQDDPLSQYRSDSDQQLDASYHDVAVTSLWVYLLYNYLALVRDRFGDDTVDSVWAYQQVLFENEDPGAVEAIESAFGLIDMALGVGVSDRVPLSPAVALHPELSVSLALLFGLPESPAYLGERRGDTPSAAAVPPGLDWYLAGLLSRGQKKILEEFSGVFDSFSLQQRRACQA